MAVGCPLTANVGFVATCGMRCTHILHALHACVAAAARRVSVLVAVQTGVKKKATAAKKTWKIATVPFFIANFANIMLRYALCREGRCQQKNMWSLKSCKTDAVLSENYQLLKTK